MSSSPEQALYRLRRVNGDPYWFRTTGGVLCVEISEPTTLGIMGPFETYSIQRARQLNRVSGEDHEAIKCLCYNEAYYPQNFAGKEGTFNV